MEFMRRWSSSSRRRCVSESESQSNSKQAACRPTQPMSRKMSVPVSEGRVPPVGGSGGGSPASSAAAPAKPAAQEQGGPTAADTTPRRPTRRSAQDYRFGREIGQGSFSTVYIGKDIHTDREVAIKVCEKRHIIRERKTEYVRRERDILNHLSQNRRRDCPFFISLYCTFQDEERLYFVLSYAKRGELLTHLAKVGTFDLAVTKFYAAELLHAVEHLHRVGVIHRDLKPENILLDEQMHIKISDFGSAKMLTREEGLQLMMQGRSAPSSTCGDGDTDGDGEGDADADGDDGDESDTMAENERPPTRRNSFVGTAEYVSPELLQEKTTSHASDLWALGCVIYQMVAGLPPFRSRSQYMIFKKILALDYVIPPEGFSVEVTDLIQKLLVLEPWKRLGADDPGTDYPSLKAHPFFNGVEFTQLHEQTPPGIYPFLPGNQEHGDLRSSYRVPDDLEPGLSDRQLTQVLLNSMSLEDEWQPDSASGAASPSEGGDGGDQATQQQQQQQQQQAQARAARSKRNIADVPEEEAARRLVVQEQENKWHRFVEGHLILKQGLIDKRKGLFARRRMFLLTQGPHLYYVDPVNMVLKGEIPWSRELRPEVKNFKHFFVHTPGRTYYLEDTQGYALEWVKAIEEVRVHTYGSD